MSENCMNDDRNKLEYLYDDEIQPIVSAHVT